MSASGSVNNRRNGSNHKSSHFRRPNHDAGKHNVKNSKTNKDNHSANSEINARNHRRKHYIKLVDRKDHAGIPMTGYIMDCIICYQRSDIFAVGSCLHLMCMECAIRMRVLGKSKLCPHCRLEIETLYFISPRSSQEFNIPSQTILYNDSQHFGIRFETEYTLKCFNNYLAHKCPICSRDSSDPIKFPNFAVLQQHMIQMHQLSFCFLCTENVNALTKDRKVYNRQELQNHMKGNESIDSGFKGHPKCLFCEQRFYDDDEQYKHLRKEHYYCQICDYDGLGNFFYKSHRDLSEHYKKNHFPCLNSECVRMGIVFRTDVELNMHQAQKHYQGRQPMQLNFQISNRGSGPSTSRSRVCNNSGTNMLPLTQTVAILPSAQSNTVRIVPSAVYTVESAPGDFPTLPQHLAPYGAPPNWRIQQPKTIGYTTNVSSISIQSGEQFPGLPTSRPVAQSSVCAKSVWDKGNVQQLFKNKPGSSKSSITANGSTRCENGEKRKKFIPSPDCFPEGMREVLKARQLGLPSPLIEPVRPSHAHLYEEMAKKTKKKKKRTNTLKESDAVKLTSSTDFVPSSSTRFESLYSDSDESDDNNKSGKPKNWWSITSKETAVTLKKTNNDFVRIELGQQFSRRENNKKSLNNVVENAPKMQMSLRSVAALLDEEEQNIEVKSSIERTRSKQQNKPETNANGSTHKIIDSKLTDDLYLLQCSRLENTTNGSEYADDANLDLQLALEMSLLSSSFMPPSSNYSAISDKIEPSYLSAKTNKASVLSDNYEISEKLPSSSNVDLSTPPGFFPSKKALNKLKNEQSSSNIENSSEIDNNLTNSHDESSWTTSILSNLFGTNNIG